jgi:hypothetical protein
LPTLEEPTEFIRLLEDIFLLEVETDPGTRSAHSGQAPAGMTNDEDDSSFAEVPLSPPHAVSDKASINIAME